MTFGLPAKWPASFPPQIGKGRVRHRGASNRLPVVIAVIVQIEVDRQAFGGRVGDDIVDAGQFGGIERIRSASAADAPKGMAAG